MKILLGKSDQYISEFQARVAAGTTGPMALKKEMARDIVTKFWSKDEAEVAERQFEALFQKRDYSKATPFKVPEDTPNPIWIIDLMKLLGTITSSSQGRRLIQEGAVKINNEKITDFKENIAWKPGMNIKIGKHNIFRLN